MNQPQRDDRWVPRRVPRNGEQRAPHAGRQRPPGSDRRRDTAADGRADRSRLKDSGPAIPEEVEASDLDRAIRSRLLGLSKENAKNVARHLVVAIDHLDDNPELAYAHARAAAERAGRVDAVREIAGLASYRTGRYAEALRELRTVRRLSGRWTFAALEADCERGLGRPERAVDLAKTALGEHLEPDERVEVIIVLAGARQDLGQQTAALAELDRALARTWSHTQRARLEAARLLFSGEDVPEELLDTADPIEPAVEDVTVYDTEDADLVASDDDGAREREELQ